jgi:hypothetical protein
MKRLIPILFFLIFISSCKEDPTSSAQPFRKVKYAFSGTMFSGVEKMSYLIEHNGNIVIIEPSHPYPYISNEYDLKKGDNVFVYAENVSLIDTSFMRIDIIVDSDTVSTNQRSGVSPAVQIRKFLD